MQAMLPFFVTKVLFLQTLGQAGPTLKSDKSVMLSSAVFRLMVLPVLMESTSIPMRAPLASLPWMRFPVLTWMKFPVVKVTISIPPTSFALAMLARIVLLLELNSLIPAHAFRWSLLP